jgi:hypothetical protein
MKENTFISIFLLFLVIGSLAGGDEKFSNLIPKLTSVRNH